MPRFFQDSRKGDKISIMKGISLTFKLKTQTSEDAMGNPVNTEANVTVDDCLIAPISEPSNAREQQALEQSRDQVRIHIPKAYTGDLSDSEVDWDGKTFQVDSDSVAFMNENTPTRWNRYFRAEVING